MNRNHSTAWSEPADGTDTLACAERYHGEAPASEPETVAMETLLDGSIFAGGTPSPVAMVSYHSYGDFLVYPAGWLAPGDEGPECAIKWGNCFNADFTAYRRLFGDTENPILQATPPYIADHGALVLYSVSGDTTLHGHYGPVPMLSMTPEMTNVTSGFYVECESDPGAIIDQLVDQNKDLIRRLVRESDALAARDPSAPASSYVTRELGRLGPGFMVREAPDITDHETSRAVFVKPVWLPSDTGRLNAFLVPGGASSFDPLRRGVHYRLYGLPMPDPVCLPTSIASEQDDFVSEDVIPGSFVECVRMDDPDRLVSEGGWILMSEDRGGEVDWFWTGGMDGDTLTYPRTEGLDEEGFTGCYFSFSLFWSGQLDGTVVLEREVVGGAFEEVARWPRGSPDPDAENFQYPFSSRLKSFAYEASAHLPEARPAFRFRVENGDVPNLQIFDPISYCRRGALY